MNAFLTRCLALGLAVAAPFATAAAQEKKELKIAVLNDKSSVFSDAGGVASVKAAQLAADDFGGEINGMKIVVLGPDHQNKTDIGAQLARQMYDQEGVEAIFDIGNSAISLAVQDIARERGKIVVHSGSATADVFGKACSPTGAMWLYDTYSLAKGLAKSVVEQGGKTWFFITADYAFGHAMQNEVTRVVEANGGKVLGSVRHPVGTMDFSSFLMQAQASGADIVAFANASGDTVTSLKQAREFQVGEGNQKLGVLIFYLTSVHALGPRATQGVQYLSGYYWDRDDASREFAKRFEAVTGKKPDHTHAAVYSSVRHYLQAVKDSRSTDGLTVMRKMKETPVNDFFANGARIRADGRLMNDMLLVEVKAPEEVKNGEWDLLKIRQVVKADDIMRPLSEGGCKHLDPAPEAAEKK
ncbi:ABC transporter substrate-binding protein [Camelimonas abortus]|uniref:ABC transporter substrate-binding protein n=1 Tax=Camelimonas abortus TaxID=1017184 RepID=A0ABV7LFY1_9HYPH